MKLVIVLVLFALLGVILVSGCTYTTNAPTSTCNPNCPNGYCGSDGCGGVCSCPSGQLCDNRQCKSSYQYCDAYDIIKITRTECQHTNVGALPIIYLTKTTDADVSVQVFSLSDSGQKTLYGTIPSLMSGVESNIPYTSGLTAGVYKFMLVDTNTGRCVYATVTC